MCARQTNLGPEIDRDIRRVTRRVCSHTRNQEVNIAAYKHQTWPALMGLQVGEGKLYRDDVADPKLGHRRDRPGSRPGRTSR